MRGKGRGKVRVSEGEEKGKREALRGKVREDEGVLG